ncbi:MAG TPA: methyltransferase domain-containing protein [Saprospiraceae bacterium]|nr:methyltransferase domain-containing protein [Saprospiraceae bacterium]HPN68977.1 methyltransferase domain-containing protein [Saprospiraceae bacterium]
MPWDPNKYNEFKKERYKPFFDLISHLQDAANLAVIDLGCGTGELTQILSEKLTSATVLGIDNSASMLAEAPVGISNLSFQEKTIERQLSESTKWDVIVANASLQWIDNHEILIPQIIKLLNPHGQLAIQMPSQTENILNKLLLELIQEEPFNTALNAWKRTSPVLSLDEYATILFNNGGKEMNVYQKIYPIIAQSHQQLYDFISGSSLVPYFERLNGEHIALLESTFKTRIALQFPSLPAIYAFKRIIIYARF